MYCKTSATIVTCCRVNRLQPRQMVAQCHRGIYLSQVDDPAAQDRHVKLTVRLLGLPKSTCQRYSAAAGPYLIGMSNLQCGCWLLAATMVKPTVRLPGL